VPARTTLAGFWKLNAEQSDDPQRKLEEARQTRAGSGAGGTQGGGQGGGNGRIGIGLPGQYPGTGPGGNGPWGGGGNGRSDGDVSETTERMWQVIRPEYSQNIDLGFAEVDSTNEHGDKLVFFTDGRKIQKPKNDDPTREVSARWNGPQLVTDEKTPRGRKMSRTLELSSDGKQFYETWHIENGRSGSILVIRYVYDAAMQD
jgi:hypothetical protein